jgi:hypothetical protein
MHHRSVATNHGGETQVIEKKHAFHAGFGEGFGGCQGDDNFVGAKATDFNQFDVSVQRLAQGRMQGDVPQPQGGRQGAVEHGRRGNRQRQQPSAKTRRHANGGKTPAPTTGLKTLQHANPYEAGFPANAWYGHPVRARSVWVQIEQDVSTGSMYLSQALGHIVRIFPDWRESPSARACTPADPPR